MFCGPMFIKKNDLLLSMTVSFPVRL